MLTSLFGWNHSMIIPWKRVLIKKRQSRPVSFDSRQWFHEKKNENWTILWKKNYERDVNNRAFVSNLVTLEATSYFGFSWLCCKMCFSNAVFDNAFSNSVALGVRCSMTKYHISSYLRSFKKDLVRWKICQIATFVCITL